MATVDVKKPARQKAEVRRRADLIAATIAEIGSVGSLDVTVGRIAKRAGISPALAFHYFGDKDTLFLTAMRHVLKTYGLDVKRRLSQTANSRDRAEAIVAASFSVQNFQRGSIAAWLNFYVLAQKSPQARRLLDVYRRRLISNLSHALRPLIGSGAPGAAERLGGLVDGLYLHAALDTETSASEAKAHVIAALNRELGAAR